MWALAVLSGQFFHKSKYPLKEGNISKDKGKVSWSVYNVVPFLLCILKFLPTMTDSTFGDMLLWVKYYLSSLFTELCCLPLSLPLSLVLMALGFY